MPNMNTGSKRVKVTLVRNYSDDEARDSGGKWTSGGSAEGKAAEGASTSAAHKAAEQYHVQAASYHNTAGNKEASKAHMEAAVAHRRAKGKWGHDFGDGDAEDEAKVASKAAHATSTTALSAASKYDESPNEPEGKRTKLSAADYADMEKRNRDVGESVKRFKDSLIAKGAKYDSAGKMTNVPSVAKMTSGDDKSTKADKLKFADNVYYRVPKGPLAKVKNAKGTLNTGSKRVTANIGKSEPETPSDDPVSAAEATKREAEGKADAATKDHERAQATKDAGDKRTEAINRSKLAFKQNPKGAKGKMAHGTAAMAHEDAATHFKKLASAASGHNLESRSLAAQYAKEHADCCDRHTAISEGKVDPQNMLGDGANRFIPKGK